MDRTDREPILPILPETLRSGLHLCFDIVALSAAWFTAVQLRLLLNPILPRDISGLGVGGWAPPLSVLLVVWLIAFWLFRPNRFRSDVTMSEAFVHISHSSILVTAVVVVVTLVARSAGIEVSRMFAILFLPSSWIYLAFSLSLVAKLSTPVERRWCNYARVAVLGTYDEAHRVAGDIREKGNSAMVVTGLIIPAEPSIPKTDGIRVLGLIHELAEVINRERLGQVIFAGTNFPLGDRQHCERVLERMGVGLSCPIRHIGEYERVEVKRRFGMHVLEVRHDPCTNELVRAKRLFDIAVSGVLILLFLLPMAVIALLIWLTSAGPVLHKSQRVGKGGRYFSFLKFRSMYAGGLARADVAQENEKQGHIFKIRRDPRVTPFGRILRRYSLDELPQIFNVFKGDMSLVGPRPLPAQDLDPDGMSKRFTAWAEKRAQVRPGITGLWQVSGRSDLTFNEMMRLDIEYIESWNLFADARILYLTPLVVISGRGAY